MYTAGPDDGCSSDNCVRAVAPDILRNDEVSWAQLSRLLKAGDYDNVVISPGPGTPACAGDIGESALAAAGGAGSMQAGRRLSLPHCSICRSDTSSSATSSSWRAAIENARAFCAGVCRRVFEEAADIPALGVCLGLQALAVAHGAVVRHAPYPVHGNLSGVTHSGHALFAGVPSGVWVVPFAAPGDF